MAAVFEDPACAEFLLQIILKREDLKVREVHGQYSIKNLQGRSIRLDILAVDEHIISRYSAVTAVQAKNAPATIAAYWMQTSLIRAAATML